MLYNSTRGSETVGVAQAIAQGIASDGGLFVPENFPFVTDEDWQLLKNFTYKQLAVFVLNKYLGGDYTSEDIKLFVDKAYSKEAFGDKPVVLNRVCDDKNLSVLELWHGPTFAFKDMALQILPHLLIQAVEKTGEKKEIVILVATSGDTGKAALEGFADVDGTKIVVFYPDEGVSAVQKLQMVTQKGANVIVLAVEGNFDDAQTGVKKIFANKELEEKMLQKGFSFSSANSINWGRLVPQIVYYFSSYLSAVQASSIKMGDKINFVVPTGNFGNILAGFYAKCMGLPVNKFICASNSNNVLADFINTGCYNKKREFHKTISPSMDILVSSNLERMLYQLTDGDSGQIKSWMQQLEQTGSYDIGEKYRVKMQENFSGYWVDDVATQKTITNVFKECKYLIDTHTAVAWHALEEYRRQTADNAYAIVVSTASPFKFASDVLAALKEGKQEEEAFNALQELSAMSGLKIPENMKALARLPIVHSGKVAVNEMQKAVEDILRI